MTVPAHHQGYVILRHKTRAVAVTVDCSWFMSLPQSVRKHYEQCWDIIKVQG